MPVKVKDADPVAFAGESVVVAERPIADEALPIVPCRVIYLGTKRNKSVSRPGRILVEDVEEGLDDKGKPVVVPRYEATREGNSHYEFSTHDSKGRLIREKMLPKGVPPSLAHLVGRPFDTVMHPDHLFFFHEQLGPDGSPEFRILAKPEQHAVLQDYFRQRRAASRSTRALIAYASGAAPAEPEQAEAS